MRGKWAAGIPPRNFTWIVRDQLAVSERPGGSAPNHRRVRRQEEIIWLRVQGFNRVVSLLPSPHNLAAYEEGQLVSSHFPLSSNADSAEPLEDLYESLEGWLRSGERLLLHQEELGDRVMGVVAGYLLWSGRLPGGPQAIAVVERLVGRQMGPIGRDVVAGVAGTRPRRPGRRRAPASAGAGQAEDAADESGSALAVSPRGTGEESGEKAASEAIEVSVRPEAAAPEGDALDAEPDRLFEELPETEEVSGAKHPVRDRTEGVDA
jgi:hypothetical protein